MGGTLHYSLQFQKSLRNGIIDMIVKMLTLNIVENAVIDP